MRLVVEVADSSLAFDRGRKSAAYARAGIRELWIVDVTKRQVEVRSAPDPARGVYGRTELLDPGAEIEAPGGVRSSIEDLLSPA